MKITEVNNLGLSEKTIDDLEFDATRAIVSDEFNKPEPIRGFEQEKRQSYTTRAIDRLVKQGLPINAEENIRREVFIRYVRLVCPYCETLMGDSKTGGGFICVKCKSRAHLRINTPNDLVFVPGESRGEK